MDESKWFNMSRDSLAFHDLVSAVCVTKDINFGQFYEIHDWLMKLSDMKKSY